MAVDRLIWKIVLDFIVLACVAIPLLAVVLWAEPFHRGFFENDMTIRLPYKQQTVTEAMLAGVGFALNIITILIIEFVRDRKGKSVGEKFVSGNLIPGWVWESYNTIGIFVFGAACQQLTANFTKYVVGRLRPHFYDVCQPIFNTSAPNNLLGYIQDYSCSDPTDQRLKDMRLSFPSAHSSFAMYAAVFFILYIQLKGKWRGSKLLRHGVQFAALLGAWYVGLSRIAEHMHHWSDVAAGMALGAVTALLIVIFILKPKSYGQPAWQEQRPTTALPRPVLAR